MRSFSSREDTERGWQLYRDGHLENALETFDEVLAGDSASYEARLGRGRCHRLLGKHAEAILDFTIAHHLRPTAARPLFERGAVSLLIGHYADAGADYKAAELLDPDYPGSASYFAELFLYTGRAGDALVLSQRAAGAEPMNLVHRVNIAHAYLLLGEVRLAAEAYAAIARQHDPGKQATGAALALRDLALMHSVGIDPPGVRDVERTLSTAVTQANEESLRAAEARR